MPSRPLDAAGPVADQAAVPQLSVTTPATRQNVVRARRELQGWLISIGWPLARRADIVLGVAEALSNVADHAYPATAAPGPVHLRAWQVLDADQDQRHVMAVVEDEGHWTEPVEGGPRGRGLGMVSQCMAQVRIEPTDEGTRVVMESSPVPVDRHGRTRR